MHWDGRRTRGADKRNTGLLSSQLLLPTRCFLIPSGAGRKGKHTRQSSGRVSVNEDFFLM